MTNEKGNYVFTYQFIQIFTGHPNYTEGIVQAVGDPTQSMLLKIVLESFSQDN